MCDNVSTHHGKKTQAWLKAHPRFRMQFTPVHCSWMNQVEQWFSIIQRKRLRVADFDSLQDLERGIARLHHRVERRGSPLRMEALFLRQGAGEVRAYQGGTAGQGGLIRD